jgi:alkaline phosphatase
MNKIFSVLLSFVFILSQVSCQPQKPSEVKNIILLIGDGMGLAQVYAGMSVSKDKLNIERSQVVGLSKTNSTSHYTTDSGAGATAIATGTKTYNGAISVDTSGNPLKPISLYAQERGMGTGIITTCNLNHATPAAFAVSNISRHNYNEIVKSFGETNFDVLIGGGSFLFDSLDVSQTFINKGYDVVKHLDSIDNQMEKPILALPFEAHPPSIIEGRSSEYLASASKIALKRLSKSSNGFFLMIEASQIDWGGHDNNIDYVVSEMLDFDKAIGIAYDYADRNPGTLVIVTADHETGGLTLHNGNLKQGTIEANFSSFGHTGILVPVFAYGTGASEFSVIMDNTDIFYKMMSALGLK